MEDFGMGAAALAGLRVYEMAARGSGRTLRMVKALPATGQILIAVTNYDEGHHVRQLINQHRPDIRRENIDFLVVQKRGDLFAHRRAQRPQYMALTEQVWRDLYEKALETARADVEAITGEIVTPSEAELAHRDPPPIYRGLDQLTGDRRFK